MSDQEPEQVKLLREILKWTKFSGRKGVKEVLDSAVSTDQKKIVFQLSDGSKPSLEIGRLARCSDQTVINYWKAWLKQALGDTISVRGGSRFKRAFDLEDFGIEVPNVQQTATTQQTTTTTPIVKAEASQTELVMP
jgi:hypothetical protein